MDAPTPNVPPTNYPRPNSGQDRQALKEVASAQKLVIYCVLGQIGVAIIDVVATLTKTPALSVLGSVLAVVLLVFMIVSVVKLANALKISAVLYAIFMIVP
jgi:hypothetical protein